MAVGNIEPMETKQLDFEFDRIFWRNFKMKTNTRINPHFRGSF